MIPSHVARLLAALALSLGGCVLVVDALVSDPVASCDGEPDGTPCRSAEICIQGQCTYSLCGDAYVDAARAETCDDGNLVAGDGCEPARCRFSCANDEQCEDDDPCTESAGCDLASHVCKGPIPITGASCTRPDLAPGACRMGTCAPLGCGDGELDPGEECDDSTPGCAPDCLYACDVDRPCTAADLCAETLTCDLETHACEPGAAPSCVDDDPCTADSCDPLVGCVSAPIDADTDGYSPGTCAPGGETVGGDCDDASPSRHPGAPEMLNGLDDDCDEEIDEDPGVTCLVDADGDGWGDRATTMFAESCPAGWVAERVRDDCNDDHSGVHPGIQAPSATPFCYEGELTGSASEGYACAGGGGTTPSFDYDCDGDETPSVEAAVTCGDQAACGAVGWAGAVPDCGELGTLRTCTQRCVLVLCSCDTQDVPGVAQRCL